MGHPAKEYISKLKQGYRKRQLVPFVGAGLSLPLDMPGWGTLIDDVCTRFDYEQLTEKKEDISKLIIEYHYIEAVAELMKAGVGEADLKTSICSAIKRDRISDMYEHPDNLYRDLAEMNCTKYLTTNYDNYLSDYVLKGPSDITYLYDEFINELDDPIYEGVVYNLHGDFTKPSTIILSKKSYDNLYKDSIKFKSVLEHFRERYVLLFIGVSLDDEYIQQVLEVSSEKLRARHYILLANISEKRRLQMEKQYDVRILKYSAYNGDHTTGIREILDEIVHVSDEVEELEVESNVIQGGNHGAIHQPKSTFGVKVEGLSFMNDTVSLPSKDSAIYNKTKKIKNLQKSGQINEAIAEYNQIIQEGILAPLSTSDNKLVIKGLLYCYILIRDYPSAAPLVEIAMKLPRCKEDVDLLSYIVDYYINTGDFQSAYKAANEWYAMDQKDPLLLCIKVYTETFFMEVPYKNIFDILLTEDMELLIDTEDDNQRQFIYRLSGEIALYYNKYDDAVLLLRKAYEIDNNVFNTEDLGLATYLKAVDKADNEVTIHIPDINQNELSKAIEYFDVGFARAKGSELQGIYARTAIPYLRSLFYLQKLMEFDQMYDRLVEFCSDDLYEIHRMKAINDVQLNKFNIEDADKLNELDKALILSEFYNRNGMIEYAIQALKPVVEKSFKDNEEILIQFLGILLNARAKERFNEYFEKYSERWSSSEHMPIIQGFYYEVNGEFDEAENTLKSIIDKSSQAFNYNILIDFYRRTGQTGRIGETYETILINKPHLVNQAPERFYLAYHEYLMQTKNVEKAFWLYSNKVKHLEGSDIQKIIEVELKMHLSNFSGVIESSLDIYEKYRDYGEMIFAYYASVAYLHFNDFEQARYYLNLYKSNGYVDQLSNTLVQKVEGELDVLQKKTAVDGDGKENYIKIVALKAMGRTKEIRIPKNESIVIDTPALYTLFHLGKEKWLEDNREVFMTFTTIEKLQNEYCYCGDELLFKIIDYLKRAENIHITSPSMESMVNSRKTFPHQIQDFYDSLYLAIQKEKSFVTAYHLPLGFQQNGLPILLPEGFKTVKEVNSEILIYTGNVHDVL